MTEYEVKCPQTWAWYTAYVQDYDVDEKKLYITYPDDWKKSEWVDIDSVRDKFDESTLTNWRPSEGEEVECKAKAEQHERYGWWPCKAKKYINNNGEDNNNDLYSVAFIGWGDQHNEILGIEFIRPKSKSRELKTLSRNMYREVYEVKEIGMQEWVKKHCDNGTILNTLMPHKNIAQQIIHIDYLPESSKLLLIGVKRVLITMKDIIYCFFERQKALLKLEEKTKKMEEKSRAKKEEELKAEKHTFNIHPLLSGYLRGREGKRIKDVEENFKGKIIRIHPQMETCYVAAKDRISLKAAVDELQIVCKKVIIPADEMGQIIGTKGEQIQDIKKKSEVIKVISWRKWPLEFEQLQRNQRNRYIKWDENNYYDENYNDQEENIVDDKDVPDIIKNATQDNMFNDEDIIDLSIGYEPNEYIDPQQQSENNNNNNNNNNNDNMKNNQNLTDALVIIGRKSRVDLCIFMIEMTLNHFRTITKTKNNVFDLRVKIADIKGNKRPPNPTRSRGKGRGGRGGRGRGNRGRGGRGRRTYQKRYDNNNDNWNKNYDDGNNNNNNNYNNYDENKDNSPTQNTYDENYNDDGNNNNNYNYNKPRGGGGRGRGRGRGKRGRGRGRYRGRGRGRYQNYQGGRYQERQRSGARKYVKSGSNYNQNGNANYNQNYDDPNYYDSQQQQGNDDGGNYPQYDDNQGNNNNNNDNNDNNDDNQQIGGNQQNKKKKRPRRKRNKTAKNADNNNNSGGQQSGQQTEQIST